jgi:hypothetical protein
MVRKRSTSADLDVQDDQVHGGEELLVVEEAVLVDVAQGPDPRQAQVVEATFAEEVEHGTVRALDGALQRGETLRNESMSLLEVDYR